MRRTGLAKSLASALAGAALIVLGSDGLRACPGQPDEPAPVCSPQAEEMMYPSGKYGWGYAYEYPEYDAGLPANSGAIEEGEVQSIEEYFYRYGYEYARNEDDALPTSEPSYTAADEPAESEATSQTGTQDEAAESSTSHESMDYRSSDDPYHTNTFEGNPYPTEYPPYDPGPESPPADESMEQPAETPTSDPATTDGAEGKSAGDYGTWDHGYGRYAYECYDPCPPAGDAAPEGDAPSQAAQSNDEAATADETDEATMADEAGEAFATDETGEASEADETTEEGTIEDAIGDDNSADDSTETYGMEDDAARGAEGSSADNTSETSVQEGPNYDYGQWNSEYGHYDAIPSESGDEDQPHHDAGASEDSGDATPSAPQADETEPAESEQPSSEDSHEEPQDYSYRYAYPDSHYGYKGYGDSQPDAESGYKGFSDAYPEEENAYPETDRDEAGSEAEADANDSGNASSGDGSCYDDHYPYSYDGSHDERYGYDQEGQETAGGSGSERSEADDYRYEYVYPESQDAPPPAASPAEDAASRDDSQWEDSYDSAPQTPWEGEPGEELQYDRVPVTEVEPPYEYSAPEAGYAAKYGWYDESSGAMEPSGAEAPDAASDAGESEAPSGLELFAWLPGELLTASDQDHLRSLARLCEEPSAVRRAAMNDYLESLGSEAIEFATRFEDATGTEVLGLADDLPGAAAFLGCFRLMEQGELGVDEAADLLRRTLPRLNEEWLEGVSEITADAFERGPARSEGENPSADAFPADGGLTAQPAVLGVMAEAAARSLGDLGGAMGLGWARLAEADWPALVRAAIAQRAQAADLWPDWFQR